MGAYVIVFMWRNILFHLTEGHEKQLPTAVMSCDSTTAEKIPPNSALAGSATDTSPAKVVYRSFSSGVACHGLYTPQDQELSRREALERRLEEERARGRKKKKRLM